MVPLVWPYIWSIIALGMCVVSHVTSHVTSRRLPRVRRQSVRVTSTIGPSIGLDGLRLQLLTEEAIMIGEQPISKHMNTHVFTRWQIMVRKASRQTRSPSHAGDMHGE